MPILDPRDLYGSYKRMQGVGRFLEMNSSKLFDTWLYGDWNESKYHTFQALYAVPYLRDYIDYRLDVRADQEYLDRYGMSYDDIHDPRKLRQTSSGSRVIGNAYSFVSKNVGRLYR